MGAGKDPLCYHHILSRDGAGHLLGGLALRLRLAQLLHSPCAVPGSTCSFTARFYAITPPGRSPRERRVPSIPRWHGSFDMAADLTPDELGLMIGANPREPSQTKKITPRMNTVAGAVCRNETALTAIQSAAPCAVRARSSTTGSAAG